jgi:hypothetical protein
MAGKAIASGVEHTLSQFRRRGVLREKTVIAKEVLTKRTPYPGLFNLADPFFMWRPWHIAHLESTLEHSQASPPAFPHTTATDQEGCACAEGCGVWNWARALLPATLKSAYLLPATDPYTPGEDTVNLDDLRRALAEVGNHMEEEVGMP